MALDIQGAAVVRKKIASFKSKTQAADKRTEKAKESLQHVQESFNRTMSIKARMEERISKRDSQLDRVESLIASIQGKWEAFSRFRETTDSKRPVVSTETHRGKDVCEIDTRIPTFTEQTKIIERKCKACADREADLLRNTERARERRIRLETTTRALQEELTALKERVGVLEQSRQLRDTRRLQMELLENKVQRAVARAQENENLESELENRIIELEDQIEMYTQKKKRTSSILARRDSEKSIESWTVTLWLRRSRLVKGSPSSVSVLAKLNERTVNDA